MYNTHEKRANNKNKKNRNALILKDTGALYIDNFIDYLF
jgi:hypothetical protein